MCQKRIEGSNPSVSAIKPQPFGLLAPLPPPNHPPATLGAIPTFPGGTSAAVTTYSQTKFNVKGRGS